MCSCRLLFTTSEIISQNLCTDVNNGNCICKMSYCKSTNFRSVLIFASFEEDVRQRKIVPRKIVTKDYLCQSMIVVTSAQHVNF